MRSDLTKEEIERPRSPDELFEWVRQAYEQFGQTGQSRSTFRLRQGPLLKEFHDEIWPLASYAHIFHRGRNDVLFQPVLGNQSYDALLKSSSGAMLNHIEVTTALDGRAGYQDHLRTLHLEQHGHAPLTGVLPPRNRSTGEIPESYGEVVEHTKAREAELAQIEHAVRRKAAKGYAPDTILVVEFRSLHFSTIEDRRLLDEFGAQLFNGVSSSFSELALIDVPADIGYRYRT